MQYIFTVDIRNNNNSNNNNNRNNKSNSRNFILYIFTRDRKQIIFFCLGSDKKEN